MDKPLKSDARAVQHQIYVYLHSLRASPPVGRYQIILLGNTGTCVWTTCQRLLVCYLKAQESNLRPSESKSNAITITPSCQTVSKAILGCGVMGPGGRGTLGSYLVMPRLACAQCNSQLCLLGGSTDVASSCLCTVATVATAGPAIWNSLPDDVALPHLY